jgi:hypothetical protein
MRERGQPFFFLPMFGFADETAIVQPATQADDAELVEELARIIDPSSWTVMDSYLAQMLGKYKGENAAYDPSQYKHKESMATARAILPILHRERAAAHAAGRAAGKQAHENTYLEGVADGRALAIREVRELGCSVCNGDCAGANPPVSYCPMRELDAIERGQHKEPGK